MDEKNIDIDQVSITDAENANDNTPTTPTDDARVTELEKSLADINDKYLRIAAELENTRRRAAIDMESRARARAMSVAEKILPVADAIDAALQHAPNDDGIRSMAAALKSAFESIGITRIDSIDKPLNPVLHNVIQVTDAPQGVTPNTIVQEMQPGYMFGDNVLRTAMVIVAK